MLDNNETSVEWCSSQEGDYLAIFNKFNELGEQKKKSIHLELPLVINCFPLGPGFSSVAGGLDCNPIPPPPYLRTSRTPRSSEPDSADRRHSWVHTWVSPDTKSGAQKMEDLEVAFRWDCG